MQQQSFIARSGPREAPIQGLGERVLLSRG